MAPQYYACLYFCLCHSLSKTGVSSYSLTERSTYRDMARMDGNHKCGRWTLRSTQWGTLTFLCPEHQGGWSTVFITHKNCSHGKGTMSRSHSERLKSSPEAQRFNREGLQLRSLDALCSPASIFIWSKSRSPPTSKDGPWGNLLAAKQDTGRQRKNHNEREEELNC